MERLVGARKLKKNQMGIKTKKPIAFLHTGFRGFFRFLRGLIAFLHTGRLASFA